MNSLTKENVSYLDKLIAELDKLYQELYDEILPEFEEYTEEIRETIGVYEEQISKAKSDAEKEQVRKNRVSSLLALTVLSLAFNRKIESLANKITNTNNKALSIINSSLPEQYSTNYRNSCNEIVQYLKSSKLNVNFEILSDKQILDLINTGSIYLQYKKLNITKDKSWNIRKFNAELMKSIVRGESFDDIADKIQKITKMNRNVSVRTARTLQNGTISLAVLNSLRDLKSKGYEVTKIWKSHYWDGRTREWHILMNNQERELEEMFEAPAFPYFDNKIMYPCDTTAHPANVYNCRCWMDFTVK